MEMHEIVAKLVGPIEPIGDSGVDAKRAANLKVMMRLVNELLSDIAMVAKHRNRQEASMSHAGHLADEFLREEVGDFCTL